MSTKAGEILAATAEMFDGAPAPVEVLPDDEPEPPKPPPNGNPLPDPGPPPVPLPELGGNAEDAEVLSVGQVACPTAAPSPRANTATTAARTVNVRFGLACRVGGAGGVG
jgi:hypothetical protein